MRFEDAASSACKRFERKPSKERGWSGAEKQALVLVLDRDLDEQLP